MNVQRLQMKLSAINISRHIQRWARTQTAKLPTLALIRIVCIQFNVLDNAVLMLRCKYIQSDNGDIHKSWT
jgi:hypothetical protein